MNIAIMARTRNHVESIYIHYDARRAVYISPRQTLTNRSPAPRCSIVASMKRLAAAFFLLCGSLVFADTYPRQLAIDVQHYVFRVVLNDENSEIAGETTVRVRFVN